jgi:hypothetical protein
VHLQECLIFSFQKTPCFPTPKNILGEKKVISKSIPYLASKKSKSWSHTLFLACFFFHHEVATLVASWSLSLLFPVLQAWPPDLQAGPKAQQVGQSSKAPTPIQAAVSFGHQEHGMCARSVIRSRQSSFSGTWTPTFTRGAFRRVAEAALARPLGPGHARPA